MTEWTAILEDIAIEVQCGVQAFLEEHDPSEVVGIGKDGTSTKMIDKIAEDIIIERTSEQPLNILSEECGFLDRGADKTLVIDPIDGTNNAVMGMPIYSVCLAVGTEKVSDIEAGLVRNLITGATFKAEKGKGAFQDGKPIHTRKFDPDNSIFCAYLGRKAPDFCFELLKYPKKARYLGSTALEMCYVAKGAMDLFIQMGQNIRVVDVAAACLILKEAGGVIVDETLQPFDMEFDIMARKTILAAGDKAVLKLEEVRRITGASE